MKKSVFLLIVILIAFFLASCTTTDSIGSVGDLPNEWWNLTRGQIERHLRAESNGYYSKVLVFVGQSDSATNYSASHAVRNATLDAQVQLSQYLISKITDVIMNTEAIQLTRTAEDGEELSRLVQQTDQMISSAITTTQFSSLIIEATHTEKIEGGVPYYNGWVCATIQDSVVKEIQKIQETAFNTVIQAAGAYAPVMEDIQKESAAAIADVITMELAGKNQTTEESSIVAAN